jgi:A/G-specific adenine glycosylase
LGRQGSNAVIAHPAQRHSRRITLSRKRASKIADAIEGWFPRSARSLPWRKHRTGYGTLVSEYMLQQTQVQRVVASFTAFLRRYPNVRVLAGAQEENVLAAWSGLGYYRRARHLHRAAMAIRDRFGARVPRRVEDLLTLPGVGRYTAGAIASICFNERVAIVDGNVSRVLLRIAGCAASPEAAETRASVWAAAEVLVQQAREPGVLNEGLMELGAMICTASSPRCGKCPLANVCVAYRTGRESIIPHPHRSPRWKTVHHHSVVVRRGDLFFVEKRGESGLWAGMWQVPTIEADRALTPDEVRSQLGVKVDRLVPAGAFEHRVTHRRITFHIFSARSRAKMGNWQLPSAIPSLAMANPQRRILRSFLA